MRGVTKYYDQPITISGFQLTRLMRGVTGADTESDDSFAVSTHTPHARRDLI